MLLPDKSAPALGPALAKAAEQLQLHIAPADLKRLLDYLALLQRWNGTYNLTAVRDPNDMLTQHLVDCLAVMRPMRQHLALCTVRTPGASAPRVLDVGSGGGLPGVLIALLHPAWNVVCVDAVGKKAAFIRQAGLELKLPNLQSEHARVESLTRPSFDLVTARAFASLADLVRLTRPHLATHGVWVAMKGKVPLDEIAALPTGVDVFHVEHLSVPGLDAERCLIWMRPRA